MITTRRGFFRAGAGAAATAVLAAVDAMLVPSQALAIAGVDDAVIGALVLAMMGLAGYTAATALTSTSLSAMGYSFAEFAQDSSHQQAAVARAIADANNLGVEINRQNAESAAAAIAAGTGAFGTWISDVAANGRAAIDGWLGGVGENQAALWGLFAEYVDTMGSHALALSTARFAANDGVTVGTCPYTLRVAPLSEVLAMVQDVTFAVEPTWAICNKGNSYTRVWYGSGSLPWFNSEGRFGSDDTSFECYSIHQYTNGTYQAQTITSDWINYHIGSSEQLPLVSSDLVLGPVLPGVDRASDAPATLGTGYDKTPIGADAVIDGNGDVVSSGTIAVPLGGALPGVDVPYSQGLYGLDAGVVSGIRSLPYSADLTEAWVGTPEGVVSMPISQAVQTSTSIAPTVEPTVPVVPPGTPDVGPWQPAYSMPFYDVWPFNLVYTFVEQISALGGA